MDFAVCEFHFSNNQVSFNIKLNSSSLHNRPRLKPQLIAMIFNILCIMSTDEWTVSDVVGRIYKSAMLKSIGYYNYVEIFHQLQWHKVKTMKSETSGHYKVLFTILFNDKKEYSNKLEKTTMGKLNPLP